MPVPHSPSSRLLAVASEEGLTPRARPLRAKRYGVKFASGFLEFYKQSEMADCTVVGPDGREYRLHGLLLAYHSEFFRRALSPDFKEGQAKRIVLRFEDPGETWPLLIEYFYTEEILLTDSNVLALFAASRELLIQDIQEYCADFAKSSLDASNAIQFLSQAVQYNCDQFRASCVTLVAKSFHTCCFKPTDGLPVEVMMEILEHPELNVLTEEQVLLFVLNYIRRHQLDDDIIRMLFTAVRLPFLSNERLASLALEARDLRVGHPTGGHPAATAVSTSAVGSGRCLHAPPADMLLAAMAQRLCMLDHPDRLPPPSAGGGGSSAVAAGGAPGGGLASGTSVASSVMSASLGGGGGGGGGGCGPNTFADGRSSPSVPSSTSVLSGEGGGGGGGASGLGGLGSSDSAAAASNSGSGSGDGGRGGTGGSGSAGGRGGGGGARLLGALAGLGGVAMAPRKTYCCTIEYGLPGGSEYVSIPMEEVWEDLAANLMVTVSGDSVEGDPDSILRTLDDTASWFTLTGEDPCRPVWVEVVFPPHMRVVELAKYTFSHGMNMIAHMFPYGISDSSWFQMKGMATQVSPGADEAFVPLRTTDSCSQHTEFVVTVDPACARQVVWRRLRILAGEDSAQQVRLSIRKLKLYGRVEVSLVREPEGRDVVAAWRRRREASANPDKRTPYSILRGLSTKRLDHF